VIVSALVPTAIQANLTERVSPTARDDSYTVSAVVPTAFEAPGLLENDDLGSGLAEIKLQALASHGTVKGTVTGNGGFIYTPMDPTYSGRDQFTYCISGPSGCGSNIATVQLAVKAAQALPDHFFTQAGRVLDVGPGVLASNDLPGDQSWTVYSPPLNGSLVNGSIPSGDGFRYSPAPGFSGVDSFQYCMSRLHTTSLSDCISAPTTVTIRVGGDDVVRVGGADRFEVAAGVAQRMFPLGPVDVVVASGEGYADALSAAPAAVKSGAALLLATKASLPAATAGEISRLKPMKVTVVGGPVAISDGVVAEIKRLLPAGAQVERIGGADRFVVSRAIAKQFFGTSAHSFVTTGLNFPDALAAGAAAGSGGEPVLMVNGQAETVDAETKAALSGLGASRLAVVGGPNAVSNGIETTLKGLASVDRLMGADRYETSVAVSKAVFTTADTVYFATGLNFPDALVGSVAAGAGHSPIYTVPGNCVPQSVLDDMARLGAQHVVLLGGEKALSPEVAQLTPCS
jgi:putative cell wall-binding protein